MIILIKMNRWHKKEAGNEKINKMGTTYGWFES